MPVTLGEYEGCASNRVDKFIRAVNSFINQSYQNKELVIISDGCDLARDVYLENFNNHNNILFEKLEKAPIFSGSVRNRGITLASGDWICYLDSDDFFGHNHLELLGNQITDDLDWCFSDDYTVTQYISSQDFTSSLRENTLSHSQIGTSSIIHKKELNVCWPDGYGHDWELINALIQLTCKYTKVTANYNVCHVPGAFDI